MKGQVVNMLPFVGHEVSVATTHLCRCDTTAAMENASTKGCGCVTIKLYLQKQGAVKTSLQTPSSPASLDKKIRLKYLLFLNAKVNI